MGRNEYTQELELHFPRRDDLKRRKVDFFFMFSFFASIQRVAFFAMDVGGKATIHVVRPFNFLGAAVGTQIYVNENEVATLGNSKKCVYQVNAPATVSVSCGQMNRRSGPTRVDVEPDKNYYFRTIVGFFGQEIKALREEDAIKLFDKAKETTHGKKGEK